MDVSQYLPSAAILVKEIHVWFFSNKLNILFSPSLNFKGKFTFFNGVNSFSALWNLVGNKAKMKDVLGL